MSRKPREISESGMYHIIFRGINKQNIFREEQDFKKLKGIIKDTKLQMGFVTYAYCFMSNHVHILIREQNPGDISLIMKKILTRYVMWYNHKYHRTGGLVENRYRGYAINDDRYLLEVVRYIHNNPVRAGISPTIFDYSFSSFAEYFVDCPDIINKDFILSIIDKKEFIDFHNKDNETVLKTEKLSDDELCKLIFAKYHIKAEDIKKLEKASKTEVLSQLKELCSLRQLARITGIARNTLSNI